MNTQKIIEKYIYKWTTLLGLRWWKITANYYDDPIEIIRRFTNTENDGVILAKVDAYWIYGTATISINLPAFTGRDKKEIERIIVHELVHVLVNEMREGELHHEERVVTGLTKAFLWTRYLD